MFRRQSKQAAPIILSASVKDGAWALGDPNDTMQATPMKWHNFLSGFGLYLAALLLTVCALFLITGAIHGSAARQIYRTYPNVGTADTLYGMVLLCCAVLSVITAPALKQCRKAGPKLLAAFFILLILAAVLYTLWILYLPDGETILALIPQSAALFSATVLALIPNWVYYNKRNHIFIFN